MADTDKEIKVHIIECGTIRTRVGIVSKKHLPVHCFLIEHPCGNVLVDTGADGRIVGKLEERGFTPSDIDVIVLSCLDADHSGGLKALLDSGQAPEVLISDEELYWMQRNAFKGRQPMENIEGVKYTRYFHRACQDGPLRYKYDVFGDESILLYLCTGHTFGTVATLVTNNKTGKKIVLASDIVLDALTYEESTVFHRTHQDKSLKWLREQAEDPNCVVILPTHDRKLKETTIAF